MAGQWDEEGGLWDEEVVVETLGPRGAEEEGGEELGGEEGGVGEGEWEGE